MFLDQTTLTWTGPAGTTSQAIYRGSIADGVAWAYNQVCHESSLSSPGATDVENPPQGTAFFYLVSGRNDCGESTLGTSSDGLPRPNPNPCP